MAAPTTTTDPLERFKSSDLSKLVISNSLEIQSDCVPISQLTYPGDVYRRSVAGYTVLYQ